MADRACVAVNCLALTLRLLGREEDATQLLSQELSENPTAARLRRQLLDLHVNHGRREEALAVVNAMPRDIPNREALRGAVRGACLAATGNWTSAKSHLETAYKAGCRDLLCLRWLAGLYLSTGQSAEAEVIFQEWSRLDSTSSELRQFRESLASSAPMEGKRTMRIDDNLTPGPSPVAPAFLHANSSAPKR